MKSAKVLLVSATFWEPSYRDGISFLGKQNFHIFYSDFYDESFQAWISSELHFDLFYFEKNVTCHFGDTLKLFTLYKVSRKVCI